MQVSVVDKDGLEKQMTVSFPSTDMDKEIQKRLQSLSRTTRLNGFRPGKVPFKVIQKKFGKQVNAEILNDYIQKTFYQAISQEKVTPAGLPQIENIETAEDNVSYTASFEVLPEITVTALDDIEIEKPQVTIVAEDIDTTIESIRKQHQHYHAVDRAVTDEDKVIISFNGTIDGEAFEGNEASDVELVIGSKRMIEGFEAGLIGAKSGEDVLLNVTFPEDYHNKDVAGKDAVFNVSVTKVEEPHKPDLDDKFFSQFGVTEGGLEAFKKEVEKNMSMELERSVSSHVKNDIMDKLLEKNPIEVPKALVNEEARKMAEKMRQQYNIQGTNMENELSLFEDEARKRVALGLLLSEIVKSNDLKASSEEFKARLEKISESYENPQEIINYYMSNKEKSSEIESLVLEDKVVDWACEQAKVTEKSFSFTEFMKPAQQ